MYQTPTPQQAAFLARSHNPSINIPAKTFISTTLSPQPKTYVYNYSYIF